MNLDLPQALESQRLPPQHLRASRRAERVPSEPRGLRSVLSSRPIPSPSASCWWRWRARSFWSFPASTSGSATCSTGRGAGSGSGGTTILGFLREHQRRPDRGGRGGADRLDRGEAGAAGKAQPDPAEHDRLPALDAGPRPAAPRQRHPQEHLGPAAAGAGRSLRRRRALCRGLADHRLVRAELLLRLRGGFVRRSGSSPSPWCCRRRSAHRRWSSQSSMRSFCLSTASPSAGTSSPMSSSPSA